MKNALLTKSRFFTQKDADVKKNIFNVKILFESTCILILTETFFLCVQGTFKHKNKTSAKLFIIFFNDPWKHIRYQFKIF